MAPKKTKGGQGGPASASQVDHAELKQAQNAYQQTSKKNGKKLLSAIEELRGKGSHMSRITVLRLLLEKHDDLRTWYDEQKGMRIEGYNNWLYSFLAAFKSDWERPLGDERMSCTYVTALAACWKQCIESTKVLTEEDTAKVLGMFQRSFNKGFSKEDWTKDWVDPKSEMLALAELKGAFVPERPTGVGMLAEQLKQLASLYLWVHKAASNSPLAAQYSSPADVLQLPWMKQAREIAAEAAKATPAAESKQLDPKFLQQQTGREQQQQARGRGRDTDRRDRDVKRGAGNEGDDKMKDKELQAAREAEEALRLELNKVLTHLESKLVSSKQLGELQHLQALQECATVPFDRVKALLKSRRDIAKDNSEAASLLEKCRSQFGDANPSDGMLLRQLRALQDGAGYLFLDEALTADTSTGNKQQQQQRTWDSFGAFEEHVLSTYLVAPVTQDEAQLAFDKGLPGLNEVYGLRMDDQLADAEAKELMVGCDGQLPNGRQPENAWVQAFLEECPITRYLSSHSATISEESFSPQVADTDEQANTRLSTATGFALLQLQRGAVSANWQQLSDRPQWVVLAYHTLKLCLATTGGCDPTPEDFVIYNFWRSQMACGDEYQRIMSADRDTFPDSTDGAVSDSTAMLRMLHKAQLLRGPLLLAVQLFVVKNAGAQLNLGAFNDDVAQVDEALNGLSSEKQQQLRTSLFQVLNIVFASLPQYQQFLRDLQEQVLKPTHVPVQVVEGRQQGDLSLTVSSDYCVQACLSAAVPSEYHSACCNKHVVMRRNEEAAGQRFSRFDASVDDYDSFVCVDHQIQQEDTSVATRYLAQPAQAAQVAQQQGIEVGTKQGLKALLEQLYLGPDRHPHQLKVGMPPPVEPVIPERSTWDQVRADLLLAQQLAMHRQQLAKLIEQQSQEMEDSGSKLAKRGAELMMKALLSQRVCGRKWVLCHFQHVFMKQQGRLHKQEAATQDQLRLLGDAAEKPGKGGKDSSKEKEKELKDKLKKIETSMKNLDVCLSTAKLHLASNASEAETYPDLIRVQYRAATGHEEPLNLMLQLLTNELLSNAQVDANSAVARLKHSLQLARLMLFDLDTEIMHHVLKARRRVLVSAWVHKQLPVAVLLAAEAIKDMLHSDAHQAAVDALIAEVEEEKKDRKPAQQPASKKKKKKKCPAAKSAVKVVEVDEEEEEDMEQQAAADADAAATGQEPEIQHEQGSSDDGGDGLVDVMMWAQQQDNGSSGRLSNNDNSTATAAATAGQKGWEPAIAPGRSKMSGRSSAHAAQQREAQKYVYYSHPHICGRCGERGHKYGDCSSAYCSTCHKWGHATGACREACSNCGKHHHPGAATNKDCRICQCLVCELWGHIAKECPNDPCHLCGHLGHKRSECGACRRCGLPLNKGHQCPPTPAITAAPAAAGPQVPTAAPAADDSAASRARTSSRGRQQQQHQAAASAAITKLPFAAGNVKLVSVIPSALPQRIAQLMDRLFTHSEPDYAASLLGSEEKQAVLARISDVDLGEIFKQPSVSTALDDVYMHFVKTKLGATTPAGLHPDAAAAFEAALKQFPGLLKPHWDSSSSWADLEKHFLVFSDRQNAADEQRRTYNFAKEQAALMTVQAKERKQPRQHSRQQRKQQPGPSSTEELEQRSMADGRDISRGRPAKVHARGPAPATAAPPKSADIATAGLPTPAPAAVTADAASATGNPSAEAAVTQQQVQPQLQPPHPLCAAPLVDAWAPPQPPLPAAPEGHQMVLDLRGNLQPWMCWFTHGAEHALLQLVADEKIKGQLLAVVKATPEEELPPTLHSELMKLLTDLQDARYTMSQPVKEGLMAFINLLQQAVDMPRPSKPPMIPAPRLATPAAPPPPAAAAAAVSMVLPPHLQYVNSSQRQQSGGLLPYQQQQSFAAPAQLQQHWSATQEQLQQHQQQANLPAAADGSEGSDDELLSFCLNSDAPAVSEQPAGRSAWAASAQQQHGMPSSEYPSLGASAPGSKVGPAVSSAGLANQTGEYNCFLNVVVQCLYSCTAFREQVRNMPVSQQGHPVVHALLQLFQQMHAAEQGWKPGHDRAVVNPTELREALDSDTVFRRQEMNDANEFLECLFDCFKAAQGLSNTAGSRGVLIDGVFGILVSEKVRCTVPRCGVISHVVPSHWEHLLMVNSAALEYAAQDARAELDLDNSDHPEAPVELGRLLRTLFDQEQKACDKDKGGCGVKYAPERRCEQTPRVLTLQLSWLQDVKGAEIGSALQHIQEDVDISDIYAAGVANSDTTYHLSSAVAYYGQHYMAFVRNEKLNQWLMFDDASVSVVGSWDDVKRKCVSGRIQPSVLFYQVTDLAALPDRAAASVPAPAHGLHHHPLQVSYAAAPATAMAASGLGWGPGAPMQQVHLMHHQQQQQHLHQPVAVPFGVLPHAAQLGPAVEGPPPPAAVSAAYAQQWSAAGPHSGGCSGNLAAVDGWQNQVVAPGSSQDAWNTAATVPEPTGTALSQAAAMPTGRPSPVRGPAWGGAGRVAQQALGGIADQARYADGGPANRGHGRSGRGGRG